MKNNIPSTWDSLLSFLFHDFVPIPQLPQLDRIFLLNSSFPAYFLTANFFISEKFYLDNLIVNKTNIGFL